MKYSMVVSSCVFALLSQVSLAHAQEITVESAPPVVVKTIPTAGDAEVDPGLTEIRVTFSKPLDPGGMSVVRASPATFPDLSGRVSFEPDQETLIIPVSLKPGRDYALWFNTSRFQNFKDRNGRALVPYLLVFRTKGDPLAQARVEPVDYGAAYDALCDDMSLKYSYFDHKEIDWEVLRSQFHSPAASSSSTQKFVTVLRTLLSNLNDGHVWIEFEGKQISTLPITRAFFSINYNRNVIHDALVDPEQFGDFALVGTTPTDGYAAVVLIRQSSATRETVQQVTEFLESQREAPGFLIDLRRANGGDEALAMSIASLFCGEPTIYAKSLYRNGPQASDFTRPHSRILRQSEKPITKPVVCLIGPGCVSSGEGFAKMMKALPHVTLVGTATRGSSGNPKPFKLPGLPVRVWYSRWMDLLPDGTPVENHGILPDVLVEAPWEAYRDSDPTWDRAIELLDKGAALND